MFFILLGHKLTIMGKHKFYFLFTLLIAGITLGSNAQPKGNVAKQGEIISTSDIHFNPFYDPALLNSLLVTEYTGWDSIFKRSLLRDISPDGADANYPLFKSAMEQMRTLLPKPKYIIVTGDFLAHNFTTKLANNIADSGLQRNFVNNTIRFTAWMFNKYFPNTVVLPVLGNNDSYCGDYNLAPGSPFLAMFAQAWAPLQRNNDKAKDSLFIDQFSKGGYYTFYPKSDPGHELIMMNTIFFSKKYINTCGDGNTTDGAKAEMAWLDSTLRVNAALGTKANKVWLAYHIPPGVDVYGSTKPGMVTMMWDTVYNTTFLGMLVKYADNVTANFAGHTHMDDFRVIYDANKKPVSFVHITPSISRSNGNYPAIQTITYGQGTYMLDNYKTYYLNASLTSPAWSFEYDYNKQYSMAGQNPASANELRGRMSNDTSATWVTYTKFFNCSNKLHTASIHNNPRCYWCGTGELTSGKYTDCLSSK